MANRLSEDPQVTVLLLEAGEDDWEKESIKIPGLAATTWRTSLDWGYYTEPQPGLMKGFKQGVSTPVVVCSFFVLRFFFASVQFSIYDVLILQPFRLSFIKLFFSTPSLSPSLLSQMPAHPHSPPPTFFSLAL